MFWDKAQGEFHWHKGSLCSFCFPGSSNAKHTPAARIKFHVSYTEIRSTAQKSGLLKLREEEEAALKQWGCKKPPKNSAPFSLGVAG